jgi:hypothetical protein
VAAIRFASALFRRTLIYMLAPLVAALVLGRGVPVFEFLVGGVTLGLVALAAFAPQEGERDRLPDKALVPELIHRRRRRRASE